MKNYSTNLNSFIFKRSWGEVFQALPDEDAGRLIKALYDHADGVDVELEDATLAAVYKSFAQEMDISALNYLRKAGYFDN